MKGIPLTQGKMALVDDEDYDLRKRPDKTSQYKGVSWHKKNRRWQARIQVNGILKHLGGFHTQEEAALIYNMAAANYFGEFARLNLLRERG